MKYIKVNPKVFEKMEFKINVPSTGEKPCCCGYVECIDAECSPAKEKKDES